MGTILQEEKKIKKRTQGSARVNKNRMKAQKEEQNVVLEANF